MLLATLKILVILITPEIHLALHWTIAQSQKKIFRIVNQMREKGYIYMEYESREVVIFLSFVLKKNFSMHITKLTFK